MSQNKRVFDKDYFTKYYQPMTGKFQQKDLVRNMNWFYGWFNALMDWYDFRDGAGKEALEIGCAIGAAARILAERNFIVTASDISEYALKKAQKVNTHKNLKFKQLDIEKHKFKQKFDLIYSFEVIEHLGDLDTALENIYSMLKPNGVCICSTPYPYSYVFIDKTHINVRHPLDWMRIFKKAHFKNINHKQIGFIPFLYRYSKNWHITIPFGIPTPYINSPVFIYAQKI